MEISVYKLRQAIKIRQAAVQFGIEDLLDHMVMNQGLTWYQARCICRIAAYDSSHETDLLQMVREDAKTMGWARAIKPMWRKPQPNLF